MTVLLLHDCIINMIHDMEKDIELPPKKGKERVTAYESPWKWFTASELGFPLLDDNYNRPIHPLVETYARECLQDPELLDDNEEAGMCCESTAHNLPELMRCMIEDWGQQDGTSQVEDLKVPPPIERGTQCLMRLGTQISSRTASWILRIYRL